MGRIKRSNPEPVTLKGAVCPLYLSHTDNEIRCKSYIPDAAEAILRYRSPAYRESQYCLFCCGSYRSCESFRAYQHFQWPDD